MQVNKFLKKKQRKTAGKVKFQNERRIDSEIICLVINLAYYCHNSRKTYLNINRSFKTNQFSFRHSDKAVVNKEFLFLVCRIFVSTSKKVRWTFSHKKVSSTQMILETYLEFQKDHLCSTYIFVHK